MRTPLFRRRMNNTMYKLVVVDDEMAIRMGMCNYIDWNAMGFEVAADFEDGKETIEYIANHPVDVILTDIEMAEVSGLELAKYIYDNGLDVKVVILSGYKEFEYARKAIQYNVEHYLLKPIKMNEVQEVFKKIRLDFEHRIAEKEINFSREKNFQELLPELQGQFWISLLVGGLHSKDSIVKKQKMLQLDFDLQTPCAIIDVQIEIDEENNQLYYKQRENRFNLINNIFGDNVGEIQYYPAYLSSDILKIIAVMKQNSTIDEFCEKLELQLKEKSESVIRLLKLKIITSIEKIFPGIMELSEDKYELQAHVQKKAEAVRLVPEDYERLKQKYKLLIETINDGDFDGLDSLADNIFFEFRNLPIEQVKQLLINMFSLLSSKFMKMSSQLWVVMNERVDYQKLMDIDDKNTLKHTCKDLLKQTIEIVKKKQNDVSKDVVEKAISYMKKHYGEEISLESVADRYFLNPTYFSRLFKQYTGTTFMDYLIELRMEKAKELISLGKYKVYEVSQMVGYRSDKYFFRVFKQYTKQSPSEYYRNWARNDEN